MFRKGLGHKPSGRSLIMTPELLTYLPHPWLGRSLGRRGDGGVAVHAAALLAQRAGDRRGRHRLDRDRCHARRARRADLAWEIRVRVRIRVGVRLRG